MDAVSTVFLGLVVGAIYALTAFGLVLTYRTSGVFNFAHGAVGMFFAHAFFQLTQGGRVDLVLLVHDQSWRLPAPIALILVVGVLAPAAGLALHAALFRRLRAAASVVRIVATIGVLVALIGLAGVMWDAGTLTPRSLFPDSPLEIAGLRLTVAEVATVALAVSLCAGLMAFLRLSPLGIRMRAVVDRPDLAELMGIDADRTSAVAWAIGSAFAALAGILLVPFFGSLDPLTLSLLVVTATAAAVVGRLESLPLTLAGALAIGVAQFVVQRAASPEIGRQLQPAIPFLVLFVVLLLPIPFRELEDRPPQSGGRDPRFRLPASAPAAGGSLASVALLAGVAALLLSSGAEWQEKLATVPPTAIVLLSLVLLAGVAGQISLSQATFAGVGAFVAAHVAGAGLTLPVGALVGALVAVPLGALLAVRAAALPPLFLGFATLAFGAVMDQVAFSSRGFSGGLSGIPLERPGFLEGARAYGLATLAVFALCVVLVRNLRRGRTGLALAAMHDSRVGVASVGVSVRRLQLAAFCVSAFLAGLGGALLAGATELATPYSYFQVQSLLFLALAVVGGIRSWPGALVGAVLLQLAAPFVHQPGVRESFVARVLLGGKLEELLPVLFGLGAVALARNPDGIVGQAREVAAALAARARRALGRPEAEVELPSSGTRAAAGPRR